MDAPRPTTSQIPAGYSKCIRCGTMYQASACPICRDAAAIADAPRPTSHEGATANPKACCAAHDRPTSDLSTGCANDPEFCRCPEHRPTSELAADVRDALNEWATSRLLVRRRTPASIALDALVARVTDLEARAASWQASCEAARQDFENIYADREAYIANAAGNARRAAAAEAQVAALTKERDDWREKAGGWRAIAEDKDGNLFCSRAEAAEAALATTRQALESFRDSYDIWREGCDEAHLDLAYDAARRALATGEQT